MYMIISSTEKKKKKQFCVSRSFVIVFEKVQNILTASTFLSLSLLIIEMLMYSQAIWMSSVKFQNIIDVHAFV